MPGLPLQGWAAQGQDKTERESPANPSPWRLPSCTLTKACHLHFGVRSESSGGTGANPGLTALLAQLHGTNRGLGRALPPGVPSLLAARALRDSELAALPPQASVSSPVKWACPDPPHHHHQLLREGLCRPLSLCHSLPPSPCTSLGDTQSLSKQRPPQAPPASRPEARSLRSGFGNRDRPPSQGPAKPSEISEGKGLVIAKCSVSHPRRPPPPQSSVHRPVYSLLRA